MGSRASNVVAGAVDDGTYVGQSRTFIDPDRSAEVCSTDVDRLILQL